VELTSRKLMTEDNGEELEETGVCSFRSSIAVISDSTRFLGDIWESGRERIFKCPLLLWVLDLVNLRTDFVTKAWIGVDLDISVGLLLVSQRNDENETSCGLQVLLIFCLDKRSN
jgi:hypothetical protein